MVDDGTYFWHEADGWRYATATITSAPHKTFDACIQAWRRFGHGPVLVR